MDQQKLDALAERIFNEVNAAMSCLNLYLGQNVGKRMIRVSGGPA
jgi:hypothetical protein